ncbi:hypothetical protein E1B28_005427 [Marasmius oreades]|nr:uncharacterized protein E1B28_005427 [Marasmius oreades]KAG7094603.1 hypothetical protein E1B28_005427 [Marasmius oreades]
MICSNWRTTALNTPEIWARIRIREDFSLERYNPARELRGLKLCVERASWCPLSVELTLDQTALSTRDWDLTWEHTTLFEFLTEHSVWSSLVIHIRGFRPEVHRTIFEMLKGNLRSLVRLGVHLIETEDMEILRTWKGTNAFPNLRALELSHAHAQNPEERLIYYDPSARAFTTIDTSIFPYQRLTHISLDLFRRVEDALQVLQLCKSLQSVHIHCSFYFQESSAPLALSQNSPISLPYLDTLAIYAYPKWRDRRRGMLSLPYLVGSLTVPSLKSLSLSWDIDISDEEEPLICAAINDLFIRSGVSTSLRKLGLSISGISTSAPTVWGDLLEEMTGLEELHIKLTEHDVATKANTSESVFLQQLLQETEPGSDAPPMPYFLPDLKYLQIRYVRWTLRDRHRTSWPGCINVLQGILDEGRSSHLVAWLTEFESMVDWRNTRGLKSVLLEIEGNGLDTDLERSGCLERLKRMQEDPTARLAMRVSMV